MCVCVLCACMRMCCRFSLTALFFCLLLFSSLISYYFQSNLSPTQNLYSNHFCLLWLVRFCFGCRVWVCVLCVYVRLVPFFVLLFVSIFLLFFFYITLPFHLTSFLFLHSSHWCGGARNLIGGPCGEARNLEAMCVKIFMRVIRRYVVSLSMTTPCYGLALILEIYVCCIYTRMSEMNASESARFRD